MDIAFFKPNFKSLKELMPNKKQPYLPPRQRVWLAIRNNAEEFTIQQVADLGFMNYDSTRKFINQLEKAGIIKVNRVEPMVYANCPIKQKFFCLLNDVGYHYPKMTKSGELITGVTANKAMWNTLRITKKAVNADELAKLSSNEELIVKEQTATCFLYSLHQAGYLQRVQEANVTGGKESKIHFIATHEHRRTASANSKDQTGI